MKDVFSSFFQKMIPVKRHYSIKNFLLLIMHNHYKRHSYLLELSKAATSSVHFNLRPCSGKVFDPEVGHSSVGAAYPGPFSSCSFMADSGTCWQYGSLYIFGDTLRPPLHIKYCSLNPMRLLSGLFHLAINWTSVIPTIGRSGAIAGIMCAYLICILNQRY